MYALLSTWRQSWISFHLHGADGRDKGGAADCGNGQGHFVAAISVRNGNELELAFLKAAHANLRLWMGRTAKGKVWELGKDLSVWHSTDPLNCSYFSLVYVVSGQDYDYFFCVCFSKANWVGLHKVTQKVKLEKFKKKIGFGLVPQRSWSFESFVSLFSCGKYYVENSRLIHDRTFLISCVFEKKSNS